MKPFYINFFLLLLFFSPISKIIFYLYIFTLFYYPLSITFSNYCCQSNVHKGFCTRKARTLSAAVTTAATFSSSKFCRPDIIYAGKKSQKHNEKSIIKSSAHFMKYGAWICFIFPFVPWGLSLHGIYAGLVLWWKRDLLWQEWKKSCFCGWD